MSICVSFVIPTKNSARTLDRCLDSIFKQRTGRKFEVIIVDNNSKDGTVQIARKYHVRFLNCAGSLGMARKIGVEISKGEYIAFVDSDVYIDENWLEYILETIIKENLTGAIGRIIAVGHSLSARYAALSLYAQKKRLKIDEPFPSLNTVILRKAILEVGNFDGSLICCEDGELTFRLVEKGYDFCLGPSAVCYHDHKQSLIEVIRNDIWLMKGFLICALRYGLTSWFFRTQVSWAIISLLGLALLLLSIMFTPFLIPLLVISFGLTGSSIYSLIRYLKTKNVNWLTYLPMFCIKRISTSIALILAFYFYIFKYRRHRRTH